MGWASLEVVDATHRKVGCSNIATACAVGNGCLTQILVLNAQPKILVDVELGADTEHQSNLAYADSGVVCVARDGIEISVVKLIACQPQLAEQFKLVVNRITAYTSDVKNF